MENMQSCKNDSQIFADQDDDDDNNDDDDDKDNHDDDIKINKFKENKKNTTLGAISSLY
jgi:hypothetical protein